MISRHPGDYSRDWQAEKVELIGHESPLLGKECVAGKKTMLLGYVVAAAGKLLRKRRGGRKTGDLRIVLRRNSQKLKESH